MCHRRASEALEGGRRGVEAERDTVGDLKDLVLDEPVELVLDLVDARQVTLPRVVKGSVGLWLKVSGVHPVARFGVAARAHAGVVAEPPLVQVGVVERVSHSDTLLRVQGQHLSQQVNGFVGGSAAQCVQGGHRGWLLAT